MQTVDDIARFIAAQPSMMRVLACVEALGLPDCWVGAGFIRNAVWDALHGRTWSASYGDIDVVYFAAGDPDTAQERRIETRLTRSMPGIPWSAKNQARMHFGNGDPPYADAADALCHWPETCTAVAARLIASRIELLAPFGVDDLVALIVKPTPAFASKIELYRARVAQKRWAQHWPRLRIDGLCG